MNSGHFRKCPEPHFETLPLPLLRVASAVRQATALTRQLAAAEPCPSRKRYPFSENLWMATMLRNVRPASPFPIRTTFTQRSAGPARRRDGIPGHSRPIPTTRRGLEIGSPGLDPGPCLESSLGSSLGLSGVQVAFQKLLEGVLAEPLPTTQAAKQRYLHHSRPDEPGALYAAVVCPLIGLVLQRLQRR